MALRALRALVRWWDLLKDTWRGLRDRRLARTVLDALLVVSLLLTTILLFWFGYQATRQWERSNLESARRRGNEVLLLLGTALERDMRGAFTTTLLPLNVRTLQASSRYDLADRFAARHGGARRRLSVEAELQGRRVRIEVSDAGKGIAPEELTRIFDKFYRGTGTRTRGSGLGLAIVQRIIADHGGTVSVASQLGQGTTVTVMLPASAQPQPSAASTPTA